MDNETLAKLKKVLQEILDDFVLICRENNLVYFITSGALIGAVRHKGFIPWDDDIDIAMPRDDHEKLLSIINSSADSKYYIYSPVYPIKKEYHYCKNTKFCKKGTTLALSHITDPKNYPGICISIFPFDSCLFLLVPLQSCIVYFFYKIYRYKTRQDIPKNILKFILSRVLCFVFPMKIVSILHKKSYLLFNKYKTKYISFFSGLNGYKRETHKYVTIFPLAELSFEGKMYSVPNDCDTFLKTQYGNYMEIPPPEKRKNHSHKFISFAGEVTNE